MCTVCGILEWFQVGFVLLTFVNGVMLIHLWLPGCLCPGVGGLTASAWTSLYPHWGRAQLMLQLFSLHQIG